MLGTASRLVPRTVISALVGLGLIYFVLIAITFNQYGEKVDIQWSRSMTDMRMSSYGILSSSYDEFQTQAFVAPTIVTIQPSPPTIILSSEPVFIPPSISLSSSPSQSISLAERRMARERSSTPDSRRRTRERMSRRQSRSTSRRRRSRTPDSRRRSRSRSRSHTPVDRTASPSLASESLVIPPPRYGIPIVPRDGSMHKVVGLWFHNHDKYPMPAISQERGLSEDQWELFVFVSNCVAILVQV